MSDDLEDLLELDDVVFGEEAADGDTCPFCGEGLDCSHNVTVYDRTFAYAAGLSKSPVEPSEPLGHDGVAQLALALIDLLKRLLAAEPKRTDAQLREALDLPRRLMDLLVAEHEAATLYEYEGRIGVDRDVGLETWCLYVERVIAAAAKARKLELRWTDYVAGGMGMASSYGCAWAADGDAVASEADGAIHGDAEALRESVETLDVDAPKD